MRGSSRRNNNNIGNEDVPFGQEKKKPLIEGFLKKKSLYLPVWRTRYFALYGGSAPQSPSATGEDFEETTRASAAHSASSTLSRLSALRGKAKSARRGSGSVESQFPYVLCFRRKDEARSRSIVYITQDTVVSDVQLRSVSVPLRSHPLNKNKLYTLTLSEPYMSSGSRLSGLWGLTGSSSSTPRPNEVEGGGGGGGGENAGGRVSVLVLGAESENVAKEWKARLEACVAQAAEVQQKVTEMIARKASSVSSENARKLRKRGESLGTSPSTLLKTWKRARDATWTAVDVRSGVRIMAEIEPEGEKSSRHPSLRAGCVLPCPPRDAFEMIMNVRNLGEWSQLTNAAEIVREDDSHCDVVHYQLNALWVGNMWTAPRDMVLKRYWVLNDDGSYVISWQSVVDEKGDNEEEESCLPGSPSNHVRATVFASTMILLPSKDTGEGEESPTCYIEFACHADPGGWISSHVLNGAHCWRTVRNLPRMWVTEYLLQIIGIREALERSRYVDAALTDHPDSTIIVRTVAENMLDKKRSSSRVLKPRFSQMHLGSMNPDQWIPTPADHGFKIRGANYLNDKVKYVCDSHMFDLAAVDLFVVKQKVSHIAARSDNMVHVLNEKDDKLLNFIVHFQIPGRTKYSIVMYFKAKPGVLDNNSAFAELMSDFVEGQDKFRTSRLKLIPRVVKGNWILKKTVGGRPALLGKKLATSYFHGPNYIEIDIDVGSNNVAGSILGMVKSYAKFITLDLAILIEAQTPEELPERLIGSVRISNFDLSPKRVKHLPDDPSPLVTRRRTIHADLHGAASMTYARSNAESKKDR